VLTRRLAAGPAAAAEICFSARSDGDFSIDSPPDRLVASRQNLMAGEWTWLRQVHGAEVVHVTRAGEHAGVEADASVTAVHGAVLAVQTADCVPVILVGPDAVGIAHAGWRGLVGGVLPATVAAVREFTDGPIEAVIGPCIGASHYEFGEPELSQVEAVAGSGVRARNDAGAVCLDMAGAVESVLRDAGITRVSNVGLDTADEMWFSHRTRGDVGRQVSAVRLVPR